MLLCSLAAFCFSIIAGKKYNQDVKAATYRSITVYLTVGGFRAVPVRQKKMFFFIKGGVLCISRSSLGPFFLCAGAHLSN